MTLRKLRLPFVFLLLLACQDGEGGESGTCDPGSLNCECVQGQLCLGELECNAGICVAPGDGDPGDGDPGDGDPGDGDPGDGDPGDGDPGDGDPGDGDPGDGDPGDGDPGDGDGDTGSCGQGLTECPDGCVDLMSDNGNCGSCGNDCKVVDDIGQCVQGECGNVWSECQDANNDLMPCSEVCQNEGLTCVEDGCEGLTFVWYGALDDCGIVAGGSGSNAGCDLPMIASNDYYRCCCAQ